MKKILTSLFVLFLFSGKVSAASLCSYKEQTELNQKAANIKVSYEIAEEEIKIDEGTDKTDVIDISILNLTKEFYITVTNNVNEELETFTSNDVTNGVIKYRWRQINDVATFTFTVYTTDETNCSNERYKTLYLTTPRYNDYSRHEACENSEFSYCQKFVTTKKIDEETFYKELKKYQEKNESNNPNVPKEEKNDKFEIKDFLKNNKWYIIVGIGAIIIGSGVVIFTKKKNKGKKQRELGL